MDIVTLIRKLAKTSYYQCLYSNAKELHLKLFKNELNYNKNQILFLQYLNFYSSLNLDVTVGDVDKIVFENTIYEDAYSLYKIKKRDEEQKNPKKEVKGRGLGFSWDLSK